VAWLTSALFTYLAHGLVWGALGLCAGRLVRHSARFQSACYQAALFGPLVSTGLASGWQIADAPGDGAHPVWLPRAMPRMSEASLSVGGVLVLLLLAVGLLRFVLIACRRAEALRGRTILNDGAMWRTLQAVRARSRLRGARLSTSPRLESPVVVGRMEICVPSWLSQVLGQRELTAVFAHELSHLERGDGLAFVLVGLLESCCWFQPFNRLLARRFRASAELACDERALSLGVDARALAEALVRVAEHGVQAGEAEPLPAMARSHDDIARRIQRLLGQRDGAGWAGTGPLALASLFALGLAQSTFAVRVVTAPWARVTNGTLPLHVSAFEEEMRRLGREQARVEQELQLSSRGQASPEPSRTLELEQELRHLLQQQAFVEERAMAAMNETR